MIDAQLLDSQCLDVADRRRPGRMEVAPSLVPMLRNPVESGIVEATDWAPCEKSAPSRSIILALAVCLPVWCTIGGVLYALLWN